MSNSFIKKGKKSRNELFLPNLRYIVADDWIDKLGHDAFVAWLKLHTWVDRRDESRDHDRVPYTLENTWEKLGMKRKKFYEKVLRPLWEHWLIDVVEYEESTRKSQKPKNIIVYESPMNKHETEIKPLEKLRDYEKEYDSPSKIFGRRGGEARKKAAQIKEKNDPFQIERVDPFQTERVTRSKQSANNVSNNLLMSSNKSSNVSNNHHLTEQEEETKQPAPTPKQKHDDDQYIKFRHLFVSNQGDDIVKHDLHYPKFQKLVEDQGYTKVIEMAQRYIESGEDQIVKFLGGSWKNHQDKPKPNKQKPSSQIPAAQLEAETAYSEQTATSEEVEPTQDQDLEEKRKRINQKLAMWEEKKQKKMEAHRRFNF